MDLDVALALNSLFPEQGPMKQKICVLFKDSYEGSIVLVMGENVHIRN